MVEGEVSIGDEMIKKDIVNFLENAPKENLYEDIAIAEVLIGLNHILADLCKSGVLVKHTDDDDKNYYGLKH